MVTGKYLVVTRLCIRVLIAVVLMAVSGALFALVGHARNSDSTPSDAPSKSAIKGIDDALICLTQIWIRENGFVQAAQIVKSTGSSVLDRACLNTVMGQTRAILAPGTLPADRWVDLRMNMLMDLPHSEAQVARARAIAPSPRFANDQKLNVDGPYFPAAIAQRAQGACAMHVQVSADGDVERIDLTRSTGSVELDKACRDVIYAARFLPAQREGKPIAAATDVWLAWHLP